MEKGENKGEHIALLPGGFKPPHAGHYGMAKYLLDKTPTQKVIVIVGPGVRDGINQETAIKIWETYIKADNKADKIIVQKAQSATPIADVYKYIEGEIGISKKKSETEDTEKIKQEDTVYLARGSKETADAFKNLFVPGKEPYSSIRKGGVKLKRVNIPPQGNKGYEGVSGSDVRVFIQNAQKANFKDQALPNFLSDEIKDKIWNKISGPISTESPSISINKDLGNSPKEIMESMKIDKDGNLIGMPNPPDTNKIKSSISKITNWCEMMVEAYPSEDPHGRGWEVLKLPINDISDVVIMHGNDVFKLPESEYRNEMKEMTIRITPDDGEVAILLWTENQSLNILHPELIGNTYGKGIISFKYKGKLIGDDFSRDINYELGNDDYVIERNLNESLPPLPKSQRGYGAEHWRSSNPNPKDNSEMYPINMRGVRRGSMYEMYIDKEGNLVGEVEFVILEGGLRGGIFVDRDKINVDNFIHFESKLHPFHEKTIGRKIYRQVLEVYKKSALKTYNDKIDFTPEYDYSQGDGNWEVSGYDISLSEGVGVDGLLDASAYYPDTGFDEYIKGMRGTFGVEDERSDAEKEIEKTKDISKRFGDLSVEDLGDKIESLTMTLIPKIGLGGDAINQIDSPLINKDIGNFEDKHPPYTKQDLLKDLNEIGMFLLSESSKPPEINLEETDYTIYIIKHLTKYTGAYADGSGTYTTYYNDPTIILAKDNETWQDVLEKTNPGKASKRNILDIYFMIFGAEFKEVNRGTQSTIEMEPLKQKVLKYKNISIPRTIYNKLKQKPIQNPQGNKWDWGWYKPYSEVFPELLKPIPNPSATDGWGISKNEIVEGKGKTLYAFDLDDTLITSKSHVIVTNPNNETLKLTPAEYATFIPKEDDELNFEEFAYLKSPKIIKSNFETFAKILNLSSRKPSTTTIILTARQPEATSDIRAFLTKKGLDNTIPIKAVGDSSPLKKASVIQNYINQGYNNVIFYDDSQDNVNAVKDLKQQNPQTKIKAIKVSGPLTEMMAGTMNKAEMQKHAKNMKRLSKDLRKQGDQYVEVPGYVHGTLTRKIRKESKLFSKDWWKTIMNEVLLVEGGAAGHMAHPFNLSNVKNGKDLLSVFEKTAQSLKTNPGAVKIDGVNASIRLVDVGGQKQFVMDRGSKKPLDVKGITKADLEDRFGEGHGMIKVGGEVLDIFNQAIPHIQPELEKLGLWRNPNVMFNMEYVSGKTNVQEYGGNFIAIHGLNEIKTQDVASEKTGKILSKRSSTEISYDTNALNLLVEKLNPIAEKHGFEVLGSVQTEMKKEPSFENALNKKYKVQFVNRDINQTLKLWLEGLNEIPIGEKITMNVGGGKKKVDAVSKEVYQSLLNKENIDGLFEDDEDKKKAINGFVTYLSTEKLGDEILKVLDSPLGSASDHEGVVIRDKAISPMPFKITGKFILGGLQTGFRK